MSSENTYTTYGKTDWSFLTKHGVTEAEGMALLDKHMWPALREDRYQAVKRAVEEAKDIGYGRMSILEKLMYRWQAMVKHYG